MTPGQARDFVKTLRLPPNITVDVHRDWHATDLATIRVEGTWSDPDTGDKVRTAAIIDSLRVEIAAPTPEEAGNLILGTIRRLWLHELHEWFTVDGVHVIEPHGPDGEFR